MKKIFALILVLVMSFTYTVFADDELLEEDLFEGEEIIEEPVVEDPVTEENTDITYEESGYEDVYEESTGNTKVPVNTNNSNEKIKVYVNGRRILFDTDPMLVNSRTMVPVRAIFEALGATVAWDNNTNTAIGVLGGTTVKITIGQSYLLKNGEAKELDSPAFLTSGRTYVPARAIAESYDCTVEWDNDTRTVTIRSK